MYTPSESVMSKVQPVCLLRYNNPFHSFLNPLSRTLNRLPEVNHQIPTHITPRTAPNPTWTSTFFCNTTYFPPVLIAASTAGRLALE